MSILLKCIYDSLAPVVNQNNRNALTFEDVAQVLYWSQVIFTNEIS